MGQNCLSRFVISREGMWEFVCDQVRTVPAALAFAISSRRLSNGTLVVTASGELDLYRAPELERALDSPLLDSPLAEGGTQVVVDLSGVTFVDSTALHVLLRAGRELGRAKGELIVVAPDASVRRVFEITGFDRLFSVVSSLPVPSVAS